MRHVGIIVVALGFLLGTAAFVPGQASAVPLQAPATGTKSTRVTGVVTEMTDTVLKIAKTVKGQSEIKEFALEKPLPATITVGDRVNVSYVEQDGMAVAKRVAPAKTIRRTGRKVPEVKTSPTPVVPPPR